MTDTQDEKPEPQPQQQPRPYKDEDELDITDLDPDLVVVNKDQLKPPPKKRRRNVEWTGALIGLSFAICGLIAGRLGHIWPIFDVFSQFSIQFVFMVAAFAFGMLMPRLKSFVGYLLTILAIVAYGVWPHAVSAQRASAPFDLLAGERALKVAHFNLFHDNTDLVALAKEIERLNADVITLIEFTPDKAPLLNTLRQLYPYQFSCESVEFCHLAILAKHKISAPEAKGVWQGPPYIQAQFETLGGLTVIGVHTTRFPHSRAQLKQVTTLVENLDTERGSVIMMGDFNATPFSRVIDTIERGAGFVRHTDLPTWPTSYVLPQLAIDHIFSSQNIRALTKQQIGDASGSDHYPIAMTLAIPEK